MAESNVITGADLLVRELQARGVPFVSLLCGNGLDPLLIAAARAELRLVDTHNEQAAAYIADAYARLTGCVGVCAASSGVAHVNALAGVLNAHFDGAPLLLISGASDSTTLGRGNFQDLDQVALALPICKRAELVTRPERIPQAVHETFAAATGGRPGPVHLTIPEDVLNAPVEETRLKSPFSRRGKVVQQAAGDADLVREAARMLAEAKRPIIVAGSGLFYAHAGEALAGFVGHARLPVVTPIWDRGVVDRPIDEFLGVIGAVSGEPSLLTEADLILLAGVHINYRVRYLDSPPLAKDVRIVRIDVDAAELAQGIEPDIGILADSRTAFQQLTEVWQSADYAAHDGWLTEARQRHGQFYSRWDTPPVPQPEGINGGQIVHALREMITEDTLFLIDGGNIGQWAHMILCADRYPSHWLTCGVSGVVGGGVPGAMAARLAFPDRPVLLLSGDGSIGFAMAEFESAARQGLPFVVVLADDQAWGIVVSGQRKTPGFAIASELSAVDYVKVAQGFGAQGVRVERADEIVPAVRSAFESGRPTLIQVPAVISSPAD